MWCIFSAIKKAYNSLIAMICIIFFVSDLNTLSLYFHRRPSFILQSESKQNYSYQNHDRIQ